jgi:hypothetical protein
MIRSRRMGSVRWAAALAVACAGSACMDLDGYQLLVADAGDAGVDTVADVEAAADGGVEAAADGGVEAAADVGVEAAAADGGVEAGVDAGVD